MDRYAIHVMEQTYNGYHGIEDFVVEEYFDFEDAEQSAIERSYDLMDAYGISTHFDEDAIENGYEPDSKEYNDYVQDCYNQNVEYTIWKIKDDVTESNGFLENEFYQDLDEFVKKYCEEN